MKPQNLAVAFLLFGLAAANLFQFLNARTEAAKSTAQVAHSAAQIESLQAELSSRKKREEVLKVDLDAANTRTKMIADRLAQVATPAPTPEPTAPTTDEATPKKSNNPARQWAEMLKNPEMRKAIRAQQAIGMRMLYGDLIKELHLDSDRADKLYDILVDQTLQSSEMGMDMLDGKSSAGSIADLKAKTDAQIDELLGPNGHQKVADFQQSLGDRMLVNQFDQTLSASDVKLSPEQKNALLQIMGEERKNSATMQKFSNPANQMQLFEGNNWDQYVKASEEHFARVQRRAAGILTQSQTKEFQKSLDSWASMQKASMDMMKQMHQGGGQ